MTYLWGVMRTDIAKVWPLVESLVAEACDNSQLHSPEGIREDLTSGKAQLWIAWEGDSRDMTVRACMVTKLEKSPIAQWCRGILVAGMQPDNWYKHLETIENWARSSGASQMNFIGRCGFEKWLKPNGYRRTHFLMEKRL